MSTTGMVMTVTDEQLAELEEAAKNACSYGKDDWFKLDDLRHDIELDDAKYVATSSPFVIVALTAELRRLRAENADLAQSLAESRANDQAAMGWLTSLRWASGDRGERMLPELVMHIEGMAKDAGRYRWLRDSTWYVGPDDFYCGEGGDMNEYENHNCQAETLDTAIDTAMADQ